MTSFIEIEWTHGRPHQGAPDDEARAEAEARRVFDEAGADPVDAFEAYKAQWLELDDEEPMTGLARVWIAARCAANIALTAGWHDPNGAGCDISAWKR